MLLSDTTPSRPHGYRAEFRCNISMLRFLTNTEHAALDALRIIPLQIVKVRPTIELPIRTDVSWPGHRFSLDSGPRHRLDQLSPSSGRTTGLNNVEDTPRQQDPRGFSDSVSPTTAPLGTQSPGFKGQQEADAVLGEDDLKVGVDTESAKGDDEIRVVFGGTDDAWDIETGGC